mgnify:CR=1 FL=1|jgi:multidrug resistance protein B, MF superfamily
MDNNNSNLKLTGKILATGIMSFCGVVSETAMNVTFPTLMNELVLSLGCAWQMFALSPNRKRQTDISGQP